QLTAAAADVEHDCLRAVEQTVEMALEERGMACPDAQAFPDAVTEDEARVEHRHDSALARHELAAHPDEDAFVARVVLEVVRPVGHGARAYESAPGRARFGSPLTTRSYESSIRSRTSWSGR